MASRKRRPNWSDEECFLLAKLLQERKEVIRGRWSTGVSQQDKRQAWDEIVKTINATHPETQRTVSDCIKKWENLLAKAREEIKRQKRNTGKSEVLPLEQFSAVTQIVISVMNLLEMLQHDTCTTKSDCDKDGFNYAKYERVTNSHPQTEHSTDSSDLSNNVAKSLTVLFSSPHPAVFTEPGEHLDATPQQSTKTLQERMDLEMSVLRRQDAVLKLQEEYYALKIKLMKKQMEED